MKKRLFIICALLALCAPFAASPAVAAPGDADFFVDQAPAWSTRQVAAIGDTLYIYESLVGLYEYRIGDAEPKLIYDETQEADVNIWLPIGGGEALSILGGEGELMRYDGEHNTFQRTGGVIEFPGMSFRHIQAIDGEVYISAYSDARYGLVFGAIDPVNSTYHDIAPHIQWFAPRTDGCLAVVYNDGMEVKLGIYDLNVNQFTETSVLSHTNYGFTYDAETGMFYMMQDGEIRRSADLESFETVGYLPANEDAGGNATMLPGGYYALSREDGLYIRHTDLEYKSDKALRIAGWSEDLQISRFNRIRPDIPVETISENFDAIEDVVRHMSGEDAADIYALDYRWFDVSMLAEKGYAVDLTGHAETANAVGGMYPYIQDAVMRDSNIFAFPLNVEIKSFGYNVRLFEKLGISEEQIPKTYGELIDFLAMWRTEYIDDYPDFNFFGFDRNYGTDSARRAFAADALTDYLADAMRSEDCPTIDSPEAVSAFEKFKGADFTDPSDDSSTIYEYTPNFIPNSVFSYDNRVHKDTSWTDIYFKAMPLALFKGREPVLNSRLSVLVVNPYSKNVDTALEYLTFCAEYMPGAARINLMPGENAPVERPDYESELRSFESTLENIQAALEEAESDAERANMAQREQMMLDEITYYRENNRYHVSPEAIADYRALDAYFTLCPPHSLFSDDDGVLYTLITRFSDGQIDAAQFVKSVAEKMRMRALEVD